MSEEFVDDDHCLSFVEADPSDRIRDGCARLQLIVRTWVSFQGAGTYEKDGEAWTIEDFTGEERSKFLNTYASTVREGFGNGKIWILHTQTGTRDIWCDVKIAYVSDDERGKAHLCMNAIKNPKPVGKSSGFRDYCRIGGVGQGFFDWTNPLDSTLDYDAVVGGLSSRTWPLSDGTTQTFQQYTALHEFGHYLGLHHYCEWAGGDKEQYCWNRSAWEEEDLMAVGNSIRKHHVRPFISRLEQHEYAEGAVKFPWVATDRNKRPWLGDPDFEDGISLMEMMNGMIGADK